jgi:hypothetical protein
LEKPKNRSVDYKKSNGCKQTAHPSVLLIDFQKALWGKNRHFNGTFLTQGTKRLGWPT